LEGAVGLSGGDTFEDIVPGERGFCFEFLELVEQIGEGVTEEDNEVHIGIVGGIWGFGTIFEEGSGVGFGSGPDEFTFSTGAAFPVEVSLSVEEVEGTEEGTQGAWVVFWFLGGFLGKGFQAGSTVLNDLGFS
jgi:hypothetical protein